MSVSDHGVPVLGLLLASALSWSLHVLDLAPPTRATTNNLEQPERMQISNVEQPSYSFVEPGSGRLKGAASGTYAYPLSDDLESWRIELPRFELYPEGNSPSFVGQAKQAVLATTKTTSSLQLERDVRLQWGRWHGRTQALWLTMPHKGRATHASARSDVPTQLLLQSTLPPETLQIVANGGLRFDRSENSCELLPPVSASAIAMRLSGAWFDNPQDPLAPPQPPTRKRPFDIPGLGPIDLRPQTLLRFTSETPVRIERAGADSYNLVFSGPSVWLLEVDDPVNLRLGPGHCRLVVGETTTSVENFDFADFHASRPPERGMRAGSCKQSPQGDLVFSAPVQLRTALSQIRANTLRTSYPRPNALQTLDFAGRVVGKLHPSLLKTPRESGRLALKNPLHVMCDRLTLTTSIGGQLDQAVLVAGAQQATLATSEPIPTTGSAHVAADHITLRQLPNLPEDVHADAAGTHSSRNLWIKARGEKPHNRPTTLHYESYALTAKSVTLCGQDQTLSAVGKVEGSRNAPAEQAWVAKGSDLALAYTYDGQRIAAKSVTLSAADRGQITLRGRIGPLLGGKTKTWQPQSDPALANLLSNPMRLRARKAELAFHATADGKRAIETATISAGKDVVVVEPTQESSAAEHYRVLANKIDFTAKPRTLVLRGLEGLPLYIERGASEWCRAESIHIDLDGGEAVCQGKVRARILVELPQDLRDESEPLYSLFDLHSPQLHIAFTAPEAATGSLSTLTASRGVKVFDAKRSLIAGQLHYDHVERVAVLTGPPLQLIGADGRQHYTPGQKLTIRLPNPQENPQ